MKTILITLGDPNGLGPELVCRWLAAVKAQSRRFVIIGPEAALSHHADRLRIGHPWTRFTQSSGLGVYLLEPDGLKSFSPLPGQFSAAGGLAAGLSLDVACDMLLTGQADAVVTCPLNKAGLKLARFDFPGHTEFLAQRAGLGPEEVCMHLCGPKLRVSLVTTHPPLKRVPQLVTQEKVLRCLTLTARFVKALGLAGPVGVCGLNPHAGESGTIGDEEERVIAPALEQARRMGIDVVGPMPGDTVFHRAYQGEFPAVLAMYHDQGLAPLKLVHFGQAVNVTLGLPFVRTSVDHGTGYDLVGKDAADMGSFLAAVDLAEKLATSRA